MNKLLSALFITASMTACSSVIPTTNNILWSNQSLKSSEVNLSNQAYTIRAVNIPKYLERQEMAIKPTSGSTAIEFNSNIRWEERLDNNLRRVVTQNLNHLFGAPVVYAKPHVTMAETNIIDIDIFEWVVDEAESSLLLTSIWQVTPNGLQNPTRHEFSKRYPLNMLFTSEWTDAYQLAADDLSLAIFESL